MSWVPGRIASWLKASPSKIRVPIFQHNGDSCVATYWRRSLSFSFLVGAVGVSLTSLQLLTSKPEKLRKACAVNHAYSELVTKLTVFMHYIKILVGVTMRMHAVLLHHFRKMLLHLWGYAIRCTLAKTKCVLWLVVTYWLTEPKLTSMLWVTLLLARDNILQKIAILKVAIWDFIVWRSGNRKKNSCSHARVSDLRTYVLSASFSHMSCPSWPQPFTSHHLMYLTCSLSFRHGKRKCADKSFWQHFLVKVTTFQTKKGDSSLKILNTVWASGIFPRRQIVGWQNAYINWLATSLSHCLPMLGMLQTIHHHKWVHCLETFDSVLATATHSCNK